MSKKNKVPENRKSIAQNRFSWTSTEGVEIDIPAMAAQSPKRIREYLHGINHGDQEARLYAMSALADDSANRERLDELSFREIERFTKAWQRQGSKELAPKSSPSSAS
jgi:hypothetical protein